MLRITLLALVLLGTLLIQVSKCDDVLDADNSLSESVATGGAVSKIVGVKNRGISLHAYSKCRGHERYGSICTSHPWFPISKCQYELCFFITYEGYIKCGNLVILVEIYTYTTKGTQCRYEVGQQKLPCKLKHPECRCRTVWCSKGMKWVVNIKGNYYIMYVYIKVPCGCQCRKPALFIKG